MWISKRACICLLILFPQKVYVSIIQIMMKMGGFFFSSIAVSFTVKQMTALYVKNFNYGIKALLLLCFISASLFHSSMSQANCVIHISREKQTNKKTSLRFKSERFVVFTERDWTQ